MKTLMIKKEVKDTYRKIERLITLKRYILILLGISIFFAFIEQSKIAFFYILFAFIGIIYQDKMKKDLWLEVK